MGGSHLHDTHADLHGHAAADAAERALALLTAQEKRVTAPRRAVIELLAGEPEQLTAQEVATALAGEPSSAHRATVYRALEQLAELGIVTRLRTASDAARYHLAVTAEGHEHLHVRCRDCGLVLVLPAESLRAAADRLRHEHRFRLEAEQSDLVGLCRECSVVGDRASRTRKIGGYPSDPPRVATKRRREDGPLRPVDSDSGRLSAIGDPESR